MSAETQEMVARILASSLDDAEATDPFSERLSRENGWSELQASRVIVEYKRFLALAVTSGQLVCPSDAVDQAWHLHLQYSAGYRRFCRTVLERRLDHGPSRGGAAELARYREAYAQTLACYAELFDEPPPSDIWPTPSQRFAEGHALRVTRREYWVFHKPRVLQAVEAWLPQQLRGFRGILLAALAVLALATTLSKSISGPTYLYGYFALWLTCSCAAVAARDVKRNREPGELPTLEPYELLQLASGAVGAVDGAVARLLAEGAIEFDEQLQQLRICARLPATATELERRVYEEIRETTPPTVSALRARASNLTERTARRLEQLGLTATRRFSLAFWLTLVAPAFGFARILSRLGTDKPVGLLVFWCLVGLVVAYWVSRHRGRTHLGQAVLEQARTEHHGETTTEESPTQQIPLSLALFGVAAVTLPLTASWLGWVGSRPYSASMSSGGCASGCGDGGCGGGGCGGGGCGGGGCGGGCGGCSA